MRRASVASGTGLAVSRPWWPGWTPSTWIARPSPRGGSTPRPSGDSTMRGRTGTTRRRSAKRGSGDRRRPGGRGGGSRLGRARALGGRTWRLGGLRRRRASPGVGLGGGAEADPDPGATAFGSLGVDGPHRPGRIGPDRAGGGAARALPGRAGGAVTRPRRGRDRLPGPGAPGASGRLLGRLDPGPGVAGGRESRSRGRPLTAGVELRRTRPLSTTTLASSRSPARLARGLSTTTRRPSRSTPTLPRPTTTSAWP